MNVGFIKRVFGFIFWNIIRTVLISFTTVVKNNLFSYAGNTIVELFRNKLLGKWHKFTNKQV